MAEERVQRRLAAILAADVVGYSRLIEADEEGTRARLRSLHSELIDPRITADGGRIVKTTGDGVLVEFPSAINAVRNALAIQAVMARRNADVPEDRRIVLRVGVNVGDVIVEGDDIHGEGVNVAARLEGLCAPGEVYVSSTVHEHTARKLDAVFEDLGEQTVKNIARPIRVYRVRADAGRAVTTDKAETEAALPLPDRPSIAVLPFENMSGDPEQEYFADGMAEDIITDLSKVSGLFVIARNSSFVYKGKAVSVKQVGRELGVRYVLEGSVRRAGNRLRITGQLIDCRSDRHMWAERFDRNLDDVFAVQEEVARQVVKALEVTLLPSEDTRLASAPTGNVEAYDEFLRGRLTIHPPTKENVAEARRRFQHAIELDPDYGGGYAGLAYVHSVELFFHQRPRTEEALKQALDLANKAVSGNEVLGWPYTVLAWANAVNGRHDSMVEAAFKAVEIQPGDAEARAFLGLFLIFGGRPLEAISHIETAMRLSPRFLGPYQLFFGYANALAGAHEAAIAAINDITPGAYSPGTFAFLMLAYFENGNLEKAKDTARFALERYPNAGAFDWITFALMRSEDRERLLKALTESGIAVGRRDASGVDQ